MPKLFVHNFPWSTEDADLQDYFTSMGFPATDAKVIKDASTGRSKGFGFVQLEDERQNEAAITATNEKDFRGRPLNVRVANPPARPNSSRRESSR